MGMNMHDITISDLYYIKANLIAHLFIVIELNFYNFPIYYTFLKS